VPSPDAEQSSRYESDWDDAGHEHLQHATAHGSSIPRDELGREPTRAATSMLRLNGCRDSNPGADQQDPTHIDSSPFLSKLRGWREPKVLPPRLMLVVRVLMNVLGAAGAAYFAKATLQFYLHTHRLIGVAFFAEQMWVVVAYLIRRPARMVSRRLGDWLLAFGGTFGGVLFRPSGAHPGWGIDIGLVVQLIGLAICVASFLALGRSFGFAAADRGLVRRGPYAIVRHPIYASYLLLQLGYVLQSLSAWNVFVMAMVTSCNVGRARAEDRLLATNDHYGAYRTQVRWRLLPGVW
jgi:protein-S-isoprenylcysteine O-methyltransferase Ste14